MKILVFVVVLALLFLPGVLALSEKEKAIQEKLAQISQQEKGENEGFDFTGSLILFGGLFVCVLIGFLIVKRRKKNLRRAFGGAQGSTSGMKEANEVANQEEQIMNYIKGARGAGMDDVDIRANLESAGWKGEKVDEGFRRA